MRAAPASQQRPALSARERLELNLSQLDRLPTLPAVAARLLSLTTSDTSSAREVTELIESDASLTAALLKFARTANVGVRSSRLTVARAVTLLGFNTVRNLVLCVQLYDAFGQPIENTEAAQTRKGLWLHAFASACTAQMIGQRVGGSDFGARAFVCGLLHDVGKIALDACMPKAYARVVDRVRREQACISDVEHETFGFDHTVAGKRLTARWGLPDDAVECAWLHHQPARGLPTSIRFPRFVQIVHVSDNLIRQQGIGFSGYQHVADTDALIEDLGLSAKDVTDALNELPRVIQPFSELIDVDELSSRTEYTRSLINANRQLGHLNAQLSEVRQRLEARVAGFAMLEAFIGSMGDHDRLHDVCVTAGRAIGRMAEGAEAMGFCAEASKRCVHVGSITAVGEVGSAAVVDLGASCDELQALFSGFEVPGRGLVRAPAGLEALWRRGAGSTPERPVWVLPVLNGPEVFGAVLVAAEDERIHRTEQAADAWKALATAVGLALTSAKARIDAERMTEELLATNRRLDAAQKELVDTRSMSMIAEMAAGAAHELNNPLAVVSGRAQMALKTCGDEELARTFRIIVEQTERATNIVADLMGFAKPEAPQPVERAIVEVLEPRCQHWRGRAKLESEALSVTVADRTATVYADPAQLCCALDAVLANAVEAIAGTDARVVVNSPSRASDETVRIVVEDNGVGMTREVLAHATDPFYSNRKAGRGRGLGLSLAYRLIEINGGRLRLRSTPGAGTTVTIELPARAPDP